MKANLGMEGMLQVLYIYSQNNILWGVGGYNTEKQVLKYVLIVNKRNLPEE